MNAETFEPNPRAVLGGNNPPPDEQVDHDFISARLILRAIAYLQFRVPNMEKLVVKRAGKGPMGWRYILCYALRSHVPSESLARYLKINRKTMGENQQRPLAWANMDEELAEKVGVPMETVARFDAWLEHVCEAVHHDLSWDEAEGAAMLDTFTAIDPEIRRHERVLKEMVLAAEEAERAAEELEEKRRERQAKAHAAMLKSKGYKNSEAVKAQHMGAALLAKRISAGALAVIEKLGAARLKDEYSRLLTSVLHAQGLAECLKYELVEVAEPTGARVTDPRIRILNPGLRVYEEALGQGLVSKPKKGRE